MINRSPSSSSCSQGSRDQSDARDVAAGNRAEPPRIATGAGSSGLGKAGGAGGGGIAPAAALILYCFDPARVRLYPGCPFHQWTGLDCPGCGGLRAAHELLHGHLLAALHLNLLFVGSLPALAWLGFRWIRHERTGKPAVIVRPVWLWIYVAAWVTFGIVRNLPGTSFAAFAP
jgi:hypothetical protein